MIEMIRYKLVLDKFFKYFQDNDKIRIMDIGIYPGCIPQLLNETDFDNYTYSGVGMDFHQDFKIEMDKINVELFEADLDPRINVGNHSKTINCKKETFDCVFLHDVIEHFFDPFNLLIELSVFTSIIRISPRSADLAITSIWPK